MDALRNIDWGAVVLGIFALAFLFLVVKAVKRMGKGRAYDDDDKTKDPKTRDRAAQRAKPKKPKADAPAEALAADDDEADERPEQRKARKKGKKGKKALRQDRARAARKAADRAPAEQEGEEEPREAPPTEAEPGPSEQERLSKGLARTRGGFIARLGKLFSGKPTFDETMLEQVEEVLFTADIGTKTADDLIQSIRKELGKKAGTDPSAVWALLKKRSAEMVTGDPRFDFDFSRAKPFVLLVVGVNGTGKTTTIGKLAARMNRAGKKVLLAAGDTFRAAAAEQLNVWAERGGVDIVSRPEGADPAAVIVDALKQAKTGGHDVVICDTAGRLHTKVSLMEELEKIPRAIAKHSEGGPHETFLVLDATTGQNAITQAKMFGETLPVSGLVLTKLDGTAKGGVVLGISNELQLPVRFVGIGEQVDDLRVFDPDAFVEALYEQKSDEAD